MLKDLPDKTIILGVLDLSTPQVETPETGASRIRRALDYRKPEDIIVAPDCGLKYLPRRLRLRQDEGDGRRGADRAGGAGGGVAPGRAGDAATELSLRISETVLECPASHGVCPVKLDHFCIVHAPRLDPKREPVSSMQP